MIVQERKLSSIFNMSKAAIFLLILFILVAAAGFWYWERNQYSKEILKLEILGPEVVQAGDEIEYLVRFKNNGKVRLEEAELIFEVPERAVPQNFSEMRITEKLDDIYPGQEQIKMFAVRIFGKTGETLTAQASLSYKPKNLKAQYESKTSFTTKIEFVPLTLEFDLPLKVEKGEEIEFSLNYFSSIDYTLENLRMKMEYPEGFNFKDSNPEALDGTDWDIPRLEQADGGRIRIKGIIEGEEGEQKIFKAKIGIIKDGDFWVLRETARSLELVEPSFYVSQMVNSSLNYVAEAGDFLHYEIFFKNIGSKPIQKKFLIVKLDGDYFDLLNLRSEKGEHGTGDNTIIWDWKNVPSLRFLDEGDEGKVEFWVGVKETDDISAKIKNPILEDKISLGGVEKTFDLKINSKLELAQKVYFQEEFFGNSGPLPPEVGQTTTYTVVWQIRNYWNDLNNVKVKSKLPESIKLTGEIFPEETKITFDSQSREVIWNVGEVEAFKGFDNEAPLTTAFQIEFTPDSSQQGQASILIKESEVSGEDAWTLDEISEKTPSVNTTLPDDDAVSEAQGIVQ